MVGADLRDGVMFRTNFRGADLSRIELAGTHLVEADLTDATLINADLARSFCTRSNFLSAKLGGADLRGAKLDHVILTGADLSHTLFDTNSDLGDAEIMQADLSGAHMAGVRLVFADLRKSNLTGTDLSGADLHEVSFASANLSGANLTGADLTGARLIRTNVEGTIFKGARVYGSSAWDLTGTPKDETDLIVTPQGQPTVTVSDLDVAQFVYLLIDNAKIRRVLDTITSKAVLILGRFTPERKSILDAIKAKLQQLNFLPIIFDFEKSAARDITETIKTLAGLSMFVIADISNPKSAPLELQATVPDYMVPFVTILQDGESEFSMFQDLQGKYFWVLELLRYDTAENLMAAFEDEIVTPALEMHATLVAKKADKVRSRHVRDAMAVRKESG